MYQFCLRFSAWPAAWGRRIVEEQEETVNDEEQEARTSQRKQWTEDIVSEEKGKARKSPKTRSGNVVKGSWISRKLGFVVGCLWLEYARQSIDLQSAICGREELHLQRQEEESEIRCSCNQTHDPAWRGEASGTADIALQLTKDIREKNSKDKVTTSQKKGDRTQCKGQVKQEDAKNHRRKKGKGKRRNNWER